MDRKIRRIQRDLVNDVPALLEEGIYLAVDESDISHVHFIFPGFKDTKQYGGLYHGMLKLNENYPFGPPSIYMFTESGRMETSSYPPKPNDRGICITYSAYHPEHWQPTLTFRSVIMGLISHAFDENGNGKGFIQKANQKQLAKQSVETVANSPIVNKLFPQLVEKIKSGEWKPPA